MNLSFIKLDINILNDSKIKMIRSLPDGDKIFILWIGILCLGMKSGKPGIVEIGDGIPFTAELLSVELNIPITTVRLGLKMFQDFRMIEIWENSELFISNFEKHQSLEKIRTAAEVSQKSSKKYREKMKALQQGDGHAMVTTKEVTTQNNTKIENRDIYTSPGGEEHESNEVYKTKKGKLLSGQRLSSFMRFWDAFGKRQGKAEAADAWLAISPLTNAIVDQICAAAKIECKNRPELEARGMTAKMAQGWLSGRRWEDESLSGNNEQKPETKEQILKRHGLSA